MIGKMDKYTKDRDASAEEKEVEYQGLLADNPPIDWLQYPKVLRNQPDFPKYFAKLLNFIEAREPANPPFFHVSLPKHIQVAIQGAFTIGSQRDYADEFEREVLGLKDSSDSKESEESEEQGEQQGEES